jgi:hypothetical protein
MYKPMISNNFSIVVTVLILLALVSGCTDPVVSIEVKSAQKISATNGNFVGPLDDGDEFGSAVASPGDLNSDGVADFVVGAPLDDDGGTDRGALWVLFMDSTGKVIAEQKISNNEGGFLGVLDDGDQFGASVASLGDLDLDGIPDLAVGAPMDDDGGNNRGAVWVLFMNTDGTVRLQQKISDDSGGIDLPLQNSFADDDQFGGAVANIGDLNNDGIPDLAVGARYDDTGGADRGAVWVLFMARDGTVGTAKKVAFKTGGFGGNLENGYQFGSAVAGIGDLNGDGVRDIAVGSRGDDDGGTDRGAVWILFMNADGTVRSAGKISQSSGKLGDGLTDGDAFGSALANAGDLNGDGVVDLAVGAEMDDDGGSLRGAVWVLFMQSNGEVISKSKLSKTQGNFGGNTDGDLFGSAITGIGDLDGDGALDFAAGARRDDDGGTDRGALWVLFMQKPVTDNGIHPFSNNN